MITITQRYTITYELDGGTENTNPTYYTVLDEFELNPPVKSGYEFLGWTGSNGTTPQKEVKIEKGSTGDKLFRANWREINPANTYKYMIEVYLENLDGTYDDTPVDTKIYSAQRNTVIKPIPPAYDGFTAPEAEQRLLNVDGLVFKCYYARNSYNITFEKGPGVKDIVGESVGKTSLKFGEPIKVTATLENGYQNLVWVDDGVRLDKLYTTMPSKDLKLKAVGVPIEYTITYDLDGGEAPNNPTKYTIEDEILLENPVKEGYEFTGWTGSNGQIPQANLKILRGSQGNMHFKANWKEAEEEWQLGVKFDKTYQTRGKVTVHLISNIKLKPTDGWTLSEDKLTLSKDYYKNTTVEVIVENVRGEKKKVGFKITNIDNEPPLGTVRYKYLDDGTELVTLIANEQIQDIDGWYTEDHITFTKLYIDNIVEDVVLKDLAGNESTQKITVNKVVGRVNNLQTNVGDTVGAALGRDALEEENKSKNNMPYSGAKTAIGLLLVIPLTVFAVISYKKSKEYKSNWY